MSVLGFKLFATGLVLVGFSLPAGVATVEIPRANLVCFVGLVAGAVLTLLGALIMIWSQ